MALVRWDPFRDLASSEDRFNRLFNAFPFRVEDSVLTRGPWAPAVDIYETPSHELVVKAELPDMKREDISVTVENGTLTISGERKHEQDVSEEHFHRRERSVGRFSRSFSLPSTVDTSRVAAEYRDGVLRVTLPLRDEAKPKQIAIAS